MTTSSLPLLYHNERQNIMKTKASKFLISLLAILFVVTMIVTGFSVNLVENTFDNNTDMNRHLSHHIHNHEDIQISGKIQSCMGWALDDLPALKSFLKEGHVESYTNNITVSFISGHHHGSVLAIYHSKQGDKNRGKDESDSIPIETIDLSKTKSVDGLHQLFEAKGFLRKSPEEVERVLRHRQNEMEKTQTTRKEYLLKLREKQLKENPYMAKYLGGWMHRYDLLVEFMTLPKRLHSLNMERW